MNVIKMYVDVRMNAFEKEVIIDHIYFDLGFEDRFRESADGKHFIGRLNKQDLWELTRFIERLTRHEEGSDAEELLKSCHKRCSRILSSMAG